MATEGSELLDLWVLGTIETVPQIEVNNLFDVPGDDPAGDMELVTPPELKNRFPTPPSAWGFLVDVDCDLLNSMMPPTTLVGLYQASALAPGSDILEPTLGQIWPR